MQRKTGFAAPAGSTPLSRQSILYKKGKNYLYIMLQKKTTISAAVAQRGRADLAKKGLSWLLTSWSSVQVRPAAPFKLEDKALPAKTLM